MKARVIAYRTTTAAITLELAAGGLTDLARGRTGLVVGEPVAAVVRHLGYPPYLLTILGVLKVLGAAAILAPGLPRLKEWAYAGTIFELGGAVLSGLAVGDRLESLATPSMFAAIAMASWALRPESRMLGTLGFPQLTPARGSRDRDPPTAGEPADRQSDSRRSAAGARLGPDGPVRQPRP
jgi:DoxX-like family